MSSWYLSEDSNKDICIEDDLIKNNNDESSQSLVRDIINEGSADVGDFNFEEFNTAMNELNVSNISERSNNNAADISNVDASQAEISRADIDISLVDTSRADTSHECESVELLSTCEFSLNANAPDFTFKQFDGYRGKSNHLISDSLDSDTFSSGMGEKPSYLSSSSSSGLELLEETRGDHSNHWSGVPFMNRSSSNINYYADDKLDKNINRDALSDLDTCNTSSGKHWPSLQIVCPDQIMMSTGISSFTELKSAHDSPPSKQSLNVTIGSPIKSNRSVGGLHSTARPYYPIGMSASVDELMPMASMPYPKGGMNFAYSPTGARASAYELNNRNSSLCSPLGGGGSMSMSGYRVGGSSLTPTNSSGLSMSMSNLRSPVNRIDRRFMEPLDGYIYQIQFKRAHKNYILAPSAPLNIIPGDFVKVEADRGEDMGIVLSKISATEFEEVIPTAGYRGRGFSSGQGERKFLFRLASPEERALLAIKVFDEERALEVIRSKVLEQMLPMSILDAEYQFDRHKLTFFFEADRRIDFRELVSELFSLYKTRIWMQQVDTTVLGQHDPGTELAKATGFLPADRDDFAFYQQSQLYRSIESPSGLSMLHSNVLQSPNVASTPTTLSGNRGSAGLIGGYPFGGTELDLQSSSPLSHSRKLGSSQLYGLGNSNNPSTHHHQQHHHHQQQQSQHTTSSSLLYPDDDYFSCDNDSSGMLGMNIMNNSRSNSSNHGWNFRAM